MEAFILAGGASARMGADKAQMRLGEETFVARIASQLNSVARRVRVVSARHGVELNGYEVVADLREDAGALGGIYTALVYAESAWAFVVSCDLPFVTKELFARLIAVRDASLAQDDAIEIVAPVQADGMRQPLCALYRAAACRARTAIMLDAGERRAQAILRRAKTRFVQFSELADLPAAELFFINVNTPEDYQRAREIYAKL
jgi:molybdopterin-guanine dinucleotide biosynthesis protein A